MVSLIINALLWFVGKLRCSPKTQNRDTLIITRSNSEVKLIEMSAELIGLIFKWEGNSSNVINALKYMNILVLEAAEEIPVDVSTNTTHLHLVTSSSILHRWVLSYVFILAELVMSNDLRCGKWE